MGIVSSIRKYKYYDHYGDRYRFFLGDNAAWIEQENGYREGRALAVDIGFYDHVGEFDELVYGEHWHRDSRWYLSHHISIIVWRWAISLIVRGKRIDGPTWDALPEDEA